MNEVEALEKILNHADEFYNRSRKLDFIKYYYETYSIEAVATMIPDVFGQAGGMERILQKDLCLFEEKEITALFVYAEWGRKSYFHSVKTLIKQYVDWCRNSGYEVGFHFSLRNFKRTPIIISLDDKWYPFKSEKELTTFFKTLFNLEAEKAAHCMRYLMILLIWEGFEATEAANIKKSDIDWENRWIRNAKCISDNRVLSDETFEMIKYCNDVKKIPLKRGNGIAVFDIEDSPYLIRNTQSKMLTKKTRPCERRSPDSNYPFIIRKLIEEKTNSNYFFTYKNLWYNGMFFRAANGDNASFEMIQKLKLDEEFEIYEHGFFSSLN